MLSGLVMGMSNVIIIFLPLLFHVDDGEAIYILYENS